MKTVLGFLILFISQISLTEGVAFAAEVEPEKMQIRPKEDCRVCGMWIDQYMRSAGELVYKDGTQTEHTCGVACLLRIVDDEGGPSEFSSLKVHDWISGKIVDATTAYYVIGSDVIPDMLPNYVAFAKQEEAEAFAAEKGGAVITFDQAMADISPVGQTAPFRLRNAVTPGAGFLSVGFVYGYLERTRVKLGTDGIDPSAFINNNRSQPRTPYEVDGSQQTLIFNYAPTDHISLFMNVPWYERRLKTLVRNPSNGQIVGENNEENGIGDIGLEGRWNFWNSTFYDQFATVLLGTSLPTGQFNHKTRLNPISKKQEIATPPSLQLGQGTATFTGGLLYSQRWGDFWVHGSALYRVNPENQYNYAYGDDASLGVAFHYTPNYNLMVGLETDVVYSEKNEYSGNKIGNTGGTRTNLAFVFDYRFLNAFGGNFKLRGSVGLPIYENLNYQDSINPASGKPFQQAQLGDGFFGNLAVTWTTRMSPYEP